MAKDLPVFNFSTAFRTAYSNILKARAYKENGVERGEPKFDATFIIPTDNPELKALQAEVISILKSANPGKKIVARRLTQDELDAGDVVEVNVPWKAGEAFVKKAKSKRKPEDQEKDKARYDAILAGSNVVLKASSKFQPALSAVENKALLELDTDEKIAAKGPKFFYPGSFLVPGFKLNYYPAKGDKPEGVSLYLDAVLFARNGEKFGGTGRRAASDVFKGYLGNITDEDPTQGQRDELDDEIPF